jgi:hypothetical protein
MIWRPPKVRARVAKRSPADFTCGRPRRLPTPEIKDPLTPLGRPRWPAGPVPLALCGWTPTRPVPRFCPRTGRRLDEGWKARLAAMETACLASWQTFAPARGEREQRWPSSGSEVRLAGNQGRKSWRLE